MKYGKIRIEDGNFIFSKHMMMNYLPCKDIIWAYKRKEGIEAIQYQFTGDHYTKKEKISV